MSTELVADGKLPYPLFLITQNSQSEAVIKKIPVGVGVSVLSFLSRDHTKWSVLEVKDNRRSLTWNIDLKNKKDGGGIGDKNFFRLHKKFCKFSSRGPPLTGSGKIDRENKKPHVRIFLGLKDRDGLEGYR